MIHQNNQRQTVGGVVLSYVLIILNALYGIVIMPYIIGRVGAAEYGVYKTITAFTSALMVLDLGMGSTAMRYIAKFRVVNQDESIASCVKMLLIQACVLSGVVVIVAAGVYVSLDTIYQNGLTSAEIIRAKQLFPILSITVVLHLFENVMNGVISGYNRFLIANGIKLVRLLLRVLLVILLLALFNNSLILVIIDLALTVTVLLAEAMVVRHVLCVRVKGGKCSKELFLDTFRYSITMLVGAIVGQVSNNLDNVVVGALESAIAVTVYSVALQFYNMFIQIGASVSGVLLPAVVASLESDDEKMCRTRRLIIRVGRIQFMLLAAAFAGFCLVGKEFIAALMGSSSYQDAYYIALILMPPAMLELCINVCLSIIRAKNMLGYYTKMLICAVLLNLGITIIGTYLYNYYAAAIGTAVSLLLFRVLLMNLYYRKRFGFQMWKMYREIISRTWVCVLASSIVCVAVKWGVSDRGSVVFAILAFLITYVVTLFKYGMREEEKKGIYSSRRKNRNLR